MPRLTAAPSPALYEQVRAVLTQARSRAWQAVNFEMVACYWEIGRLIVEEEQKGATRELGAACLERVDVPRDCGPITTKGL